jgi:Ran GTPase-activating protein (RanGAP) involved in mRNA processing and transport
MQNPTNFAEDFKNILNSIIKNEVKTINLRDKTIENVEAIALAEALKVNTTLTELYLSGNKIEPAGAQAIAGALEVNTALTELKIANSNIGDVGAQALAGALEKNKTLTKLDLSGNKIGDDGVEALAKALEKNNTLTELNLIYNEIGDVGAQALAKALEVNTTLTELQLGGNNIGDAGAQALARALMVNNTLTELKLSANNIGDDGVEALAGALENNKTLTELQLVGNEIGSTGVRALAEALNTVTRNKIIDKISTKIFDFYTQKNSSNLTFPNIDDTLIQDSEVCLKIFKKSLSKLIDSKKSSGEQVNETEIKKEFVDKLKSSINGMKLLVSCKEESNSFGLTLEDYFKALGVTKHGSDKSKFSDLFLNKDIYENMQRHLPHLFKQSAPSANPSTPSGTDILSGYRPKQR